MLFSVVIPVYNVSKYLGPCLDSVLSQTFRDFEIICVNDGSTDGSAEILEKFAEANSCVKVINQANAGLGSARNTGLLNTQGDYVFFLDSDDWIEPDALRILSENIFNEDVICFNGRRYIEEYGVFEEPDKMEFEDQLSGWDYYTRHALESRKFAFVCVVLRLYRRQFLVDNGMTFCEGIYHEDNMFTPLVCFFAKAIKVIPDCLYDYRVRENSIMTTRNLKNRKDILYIANTLSQFFIPKVDIDKTVFYRSMTHHYQSAFQNADIYDDKELLPLVNWNMYRIVSRTKLRHRLNYLALRISPKLLRRLLKK